MHLCDSLALYNRLKCSLGAGGTPMISKRSFRFIEQTIPAAAARPGKTRADQARRRGGLAPHRRFFSATSALAAFAYSGPCRPLPGQPRNAWMQCRRQPDQRCARQSIRLSSFWRPFRPRYRQSKPADFNQAVADYRVWLRENSLDLALKKGGQEFFFNQIEPFYKSMVIYIAAVILGCVFWINLSEPVRRTGFALLVLAFVIHTFGLGFRMYLQGRPPVTNLYSSAIFIGWGAVALGMFLERIFKGGIGLVCVGLHRLRHPDHRPSSGLERRHHGNAARRAGHQFVALHPCRGGHPRLRLDVCGRVAGHHLHRARLFHPLALARHGPRAGAHGLWHCLFRHPVQFRGNHSGRNLGRSILGPLLGLGPQGERRAC